MPESYQTNSQSIVNNSITVYRGELSTECVINQVKKIKNAFPSLPDGFYEILLDRIKDLGFCDARITDAVNNLIDTCVYPNPTIANIISWDKRIKLYTYNEMADMASKYGASVFDNYKAVKITGMSVRVYASMVDIQSYNIPTLQ